MNNNKTSSRVKNKGLKMSSEVSQTKSKLAPTNDIIFKELFGQKKNYTTQLGK